MAASLPPSKELPLPRPCLPVASSISFFSTWKPWHRCSTNKVALNTQGPSRIWESSPPLAGKAGPAQVGVPLRSAALSLPLVIFDHQTLTPWVRFSAVLLKFMMGIL